MKNLKEELRNQRNSKAKDENIPHVVPIFKSETQVGIICPYCGDTHYHGVGEDGVYEGHRVPHCSRPGHVMPNSDIGYIIDRATISDI